MKDAKNIFFVILIFFTIIFAEDTINYSDTSDLWIVESIRLKKMYPLFNSDIEPSLGFRRGSFVNDEIIHGRIGAIKQTMENRGLRNIELRIETEKNPEKKSIIITITKEHSERTRVKEVKVDGNRRFSNRQLKRSLSARKYRNNLLDKVELAQDLKKVRNKYNENAFPDALVSDSIIYETEKDAEILLQVTEGKRYEVKINKKGVLRKSQIRKDFNFTEGTSNRNDRVIRTGKRNIENRLFGMGYSNAGIEISDTTINKKREDIRRLSIDIREGERIPLADIKFNGNKYFSNDELLKTIKSISLKNGKIKRNGAGSFVPKAIKDDAIMIENKYYKNGFLNVEVETDSKLSQNSAIVNIHIIENAQTIVNSVNFNDSDFDTILIPLKVNLPLNPFAADTSVQVIRNLLSENGFVNAKVDCKIEFNADSSLADIFFEIDKDRKTVFGDIEFVGNFKTKERYINRFLDIEKGDNFSNIKLSENMRHVRKIGVFRSISHEIIHQKTDSVDNLNEVDSADIRISFDEIYPFVLNFSGGYNSENLYYSALKLTNRNFLGLNKIFSVGGGISAKKYYTEANFTEPYFFNEKLSLTVDLYARWNEIVKKKFWSRAIGNAYGITFRPNSVFSSGIKAGYEIRYLYPFNNFDYDDFVLTKSTDLSFDLSLVNKTRHVVSITPNIMVDFRDSKIRPRKGGMLSPQVLVSHGINSSYDDFVKAEGEAVFFAPMSKFFTLALRVGAAKAFPYGKNDKVPMDRLFSVGGTKTVRGFREGKLWTYEEDLPVLAYSAIYNSAELRINLGAIEIPVFTDFATITDDNSTNFRKVKYSLGSGIRYITPIGPIGIVYAVPTDSESRSENAKHQLGKKHMTGVIHFSIGYSF